MKNKNNNQSNSATTQQTTSTSTPLSQQPKPFLPPPYTFLPPPHIPFYPPPWPAFPGGGGGGGWPVPSPSPGPSPPGYPLSYPSPPSGFPPQPIPLPPPNSGPGPPGPVPAPPPFGLWHPPPGSFPPPTIMMGPIISTTTIQNPGIPPTNSQGSVVSPGNLHRSTADAPVDHQPSHVATVPPLRRRPVTRRSAAQDQIAATNSSSLGQPLEPLTPSSSANKAFQSQQMKPRKRKDKDGNANSGEDKVEASATVVDGSRQEPVKDLVKEDVVIAETSGMKDDNVSLPKLGSEPFIGLRFSSEDEAYEFYNAYAKEKGFSTRKSHIQRSRVDRSVISREYVCANQGFRSPNDRRYTGKVVRPRRETRVDCRAAMSIKRRSGKWVVDKFHKEHNHGLVDPAKAEKLRSHRKITHTTKSVIDTLHKCRIGPSKIIDVLTKAAAGENTVEISGLDLMKYVKRKRKNNIPVDCYSLLEYFQRTQMVDAGFFYAVEVGDNRSMRSIFWADSRSREAYKQFGDVVVFGTACHTNKDLFPFVSFVGVNHHRQPVLFGCGLLADETVESYIWLFKTLLRAMSNRHPTSLIINQDKTIVLAIEKVFPRTRYRFCLCHIEKIELENLSDVFNMHPDFQEEYKSCIYNSQKPEDFESGWSELLIKYNLKENSWLKGIYDQRNYWVPLYLKTVFFAGMSTTQLTEGMNSYFDGFLHEGTPLNEFVEQYEQAIGRRREEETDEDFMNMYTSAGSTSKNPIEEQAAKVYTRNMFTMFGHEFLESSGCISRKVSEEGSMNKYLVGKYNDKDEEMNVVIYNSIDNSSNCSCQMFEFEGIFCKHVLKVFQDLNVTEIPVNYILKRWTMGARYSGSLNNEANKGIFENPATYSACTLKEAAVKFVEFGTTSVERISAAVNIIEEGIKTISLVDLPRVELPSENLVVASIHEEKINDTTTSDESPPVKTKDRQTPAKTKLGVKQVQKKKRKCSKCKEVGHYTSTCSKGPLDQSQISTEAAGSD